MVQGISDLLNPAKTLTTLDAPTPSVAPYADGVAPAAAPLEPPPAPSKPFKADVPTTIDSKVLSDAYVKPATISPALQQLQQEQDSLAKTGYATPELAAAAAQRQNAATVTDGQTGGGNAGTTEPPPPSSGPTAAEIAALDTTQPGLAEQYDALRKGDATLTASETQLADTNKKLADLQATIDNVESDVRNTYGGTLDESAMAAAINDRLRRIAPEFNRLQRQQAALQTNVENRNNLILQKLGFTQQDVVNKRTEQQNTRQNINDLLTTYGSGAFANMDPKALAGIEASAGLPTGFLSRKVQTLKEQEAAQKKFEFKEVNGKIFKFEPSTGGLIDTGITVPQDQNAKDQLMFALEVAKAFPGDPAFAANLIRTLSGQGGAPAQTAQAGSVSPLAGKKVSDLTDDEMGNLVLAMAQREGYGKPEDRGTANNNPGNIKVPAAGIEEAKKRYSDAGVTIDPKPAADGSYFLKFSSPEKGLAAMETLLRLPGGPYANQTVDAALRTWSNKAYGADILGGTAETGGKSLVDIQKGSVSGTSAKTPADLAAQFAAVLNNVPEKKSPSVVAEFNKRIEAGDIHGAKAYVDDLAKDSLTNTQQQDLTTLDDAKQGASIALEDINSFKGVQAGPYKALLEKAKPWIGLKQDKKYAKVYAAIEQFQSSIRRSKFGTALTETEKKTADRFLINDNDSFPLVLQKLQGLQDISALARNRLFLQAKGVFPENYSGGFVVSDPEGGIHSFDSFDKAKKFRDQVKAATGISVF